MNLSRKQIHRYRKQTFGYQGEWGGTWRLGLADTDYQIKNRKLIRIYWAQGTRLHTLQWPLWEKNLLKSGYGGSDGTASACSARGPGSNPGSGRSPGEGTGTPLQYSCLENRMDGGAWRAIVHGVAKSRARLRDFTFTFTHICITDSPCCPLETNMAFWIDHTSTKILNK